MNEPTRLFVVRHGQTAWNAQTRMQGQLDAALDATGEQQAERVAEALRYESIDRVIASDLQRTMRTAAPLARALGLPLQPEPGLRERSFGEFQGHTYAEIDERWPEGALRWRQRDPHFAPLGGESLVAFNERCIATAERLCAAHAGATMVWFTHGGVLDCLYRAATRIALDAPRSWPLGNAAINRLLHSDQGLMLVGWGDSRHLDAAAPETAEA
ncbi:MAG: histidine phosphatase family protein [Burkholderiaceae bacterium]